MNMVKFVFVLCALCVLGCATTDYSYHYGELIYKRITAKDSCVSQAKFYAWMLGGNAKIMSNGKHAFVVMDGYIYDSTNMPYTGRSVDDIYVKCVYGDKETWTEMTPR